MKLINFIMDPSTDKLSSSRLCLLVLILLIDPIFIYLCAAKIMPQYAVAPIATMLAITTGAVAGIYGVSTYTSGNFGIQNFLSTQVTGKVDIPRGG